LILGVSFVQLLRFFPHFGLFFPESFSWSPWILLNVSALFFVYLRATWDKKYNPQVVEIRHTCHLRLPFM
jgi:hypothetical protein